MSILKGNYEDSSHAMLCQWMACVPVHLLNIYRGKSIDLLMFTSLINAQTKINYYYITHNTFAILQPWKFKTLNPLNWMKLERSLSWLTYRIEIQKKKKGSYDM